MISASVIPDQLAAIAFEQADCSISLAGVENDDHSQQLGSARRAKHDAVIVSRFAVVRAFVWISAAHRAPPNATPPPSKCRYRRNADSMN